MTLEKAARHWMEIVVGLSVIAIVVVFSILIPTVVTVRHQAKAGSQARQRQCVLLPLSHKLYSDLRQRRVISARDLMLEKQTEPTGCPPPPALRSPRR